MSEINMKDAPEGYMAVKPKIDWYGCVLCDGCSFDDGLNIYPECYHCGGRNRFDGQDVIFKPAK